MKDRRPIQYLHMFFERPKIHSFVQCWLQTRPVNCKHIVVDENRNLEHLRTFKRLDLERHFEIIMKKGTGHWKAFFVWKIEEYTAYDRLQLLFLLQEKVAEELPVPLPSLEPPKPLEGDDQLVDQDAQLPLSASFRWPFGKSRGRNG